MLQCSVTQWHICIWRIRWTWRYRDLHVGCEVSRFTAKHFVYELVNNERFKKGDIEKALVDVYKRIDDLLASPYGTEELKRIRKESHQPQNKKS
jgi:hypothetical protein